jgi:hypothetical protein
MKRSDDKQQHTSTESQGVSMGINTSESWGVGFGESMSMPDSETGDRLHQSNAFDRSTIWSEPTSKELRQGRDAESRESVTVLIEGGGFSFNDVFPMASRGSAAENGRAIATFALSLVAPRRRRTSGRSVEE